MLNICGFKTCYTLKNPSTRIDMEKSNDYLHIHCYSCINKSFYHILLNLKIIKMLYLYTNLSVLQTTGPDCTTLKGLGSLSSFRNLLI